MQTQALPASRHGERGFSLVASLSMMVLLTVLAIGMLSLSTISLRQSQQSADQATARANARMALTLAIGQLQQLAGPDTRATAPASQLELNPRAGSSAQSEDVKNPHWIGVWPTTVQRSASDVGFIVGRHGDGSQNDRSNYLVDLRNPSIANSGDSDFDKTRADFSRDGTLGWLVSSSPDLDLDPTSLELTDTNSRILLGTKWVDTSDQNLVGKVVRAPLVETQSKRGAYAYWVSDESLKANLAVASPYKPDDLRAAAVSQNAHADLVDATFKGHGELAVEKNSPLGKVVSLGTTALLPLGGDIKDRLPEFAHDFTATSRGLFTNPQAGGFQQDLSAFLAHGTTISGGTSSLSSSQPFTAESQLGLPALTYNDPLVHGNRKASTAPRFAALKAWSDLSQTVSSGGSMAMSTPPMAASHPYKGPDFTKLAAQPIHPVMAEFTVGFDFSPFTAPQAGRPADKDGLRVHVYPRIVLWNPYNVSLSVPNLMFVLRYDPNARLRIRGEDINPPYYNGGRQQPFLLSFLGSKGNRVAENVTGNAMGFTTEATVFGPGESLVFSPSPNGGNRVIAGTAVEYDAAAIETNLMTSRIPPGQENFFFEAPISDHFKGIKKNAAGVDNSRYGYSFYTSQVSMFARMIEPGSGAKNVTPASAQSFKTLQYLIPNNRGTAYDIYEGLRDAYNTEGQQFTEYNGSTRRAQSTWRIGYRFRHFDERNEWDVRTTNPSVRMGAIPFATPWAQYNLRAGHNHTAWLGPNANYSDSNKGQAWEAGPGGNHITVRGHRSNTDPQIQFASTTSSGNFSLPPFAGADQLGGVNQFVFYEVPRPDDTIASLARFQHTALSYQNYQSGNVVAWSFQDPRSERAATVVRPGKGGGVTRNSQDDVSKSNRWFNGSGVVSGGHDTLIMRGNGHSDDILLYDMPFEVNHRLFDNYFLSTIPYSSSGSSWDLKSPLANGRVRAGNPSDPNAESTLNGLRDSFHKSATFLHNEGAFNVNSTSVDAWVAHLSGLRDVEREALDGGNSTGTNHSRFHRPATGASGAPSNWTDPAAWSGPRPLSDGEIRTLAEAIVREVKIRGPFLSLSDFINRRLVDPPARVSNMTNREDPDAFSLESTGRMGTLDSAIRRAGLNAGLESAGGSATRDKLANAEIPLTTDDLTNGYVPFGAQADYKTIGLPGYLTQGDLLDSLAPTLTARGDTFTIRAYGEARDTAGKITAKAWCEATVQRGHSYVDPTNEPATRPTLPARQTSMPFLSVNNNLTEPNRQFGRRFDVVSFRWLNSDEI